MATSTNEEITGISEGGGGGVVGQGGSTYSKIMPANIIQSSISVIEEAGAFTNFADVVTLMPFLVPKGLTIINLGLFITTAGAGSKVSGLLYENNNGLPGTLITGGTGSPMDGGSITDLLATPYVGTGKQIWAGFWSDFATTGKVGMVDTGSTGNQGYVPAHDHGGAVAEQAAVSGTLGAVLPVIGASATFNPAANLQKAFAGTYSDGGIPTADISTAVGSEDAVLMWLQPA